MRPIVKTAVFAVLTAAVALSGAVAADAPPPASDPGEQIKDGAIKVGQGIKQGAIKLWEATKSAASAGADKLHNATQPADGKTAPPPSSSQK